MFNRNSRYRNIETVTVDNGRGHEIVAVKPRRLPSPTSKPQEIRQGMQLDVIALDRYRDGTRYWHIADANTELRAADLLAPAGRRIKVPEQA